MLPPMHAVSLVVALVLLTTWPSDRPLRIMPLGDSITRGGCCTPKDPLLQVGYRRPLYDCLTAAGLSFDFVGSVQAGPPDFADRDHEGHGGHRTIEMLPKLPGYLEAARPNVALLMAGTNDIAQSFDDPLGAVPGTLERMAAMLDLIEAAGAVAYVVPVPPIYYAPAPEMLPAAAQYNASLQVMIEQRSAQGRPVHWVDFPWQTGYLGPNDGVHPDDAGYQRLADAWCAALLEHHASASK